MHVFKMAYLNRNAFKKESFIKSVEATEEGATEDFSQIVKFLMRPV